MTDDFLELLRQWVRAEIEYAVALATPGADDYLRSCVGEREQADRLFTELRKKAP